MDRIKSNLDRIQELEALLEVSERKSDILTNNLVREKTRVIIWLSDDERKIPLKAHCRAAPFTIKALFSTTK